MNQEKGRYQGMGLCKRRYCFTVFYSLLLIVLWGGQAMAVQTCKTTSIAATTPTIDFVINGNGSVTHKKTGLMWKRCSEGQTWSGTSCTGTASIFTWQAALQQAQALNTTGGGFAGFFDWRVPNQKELHSIVEIQCINPSINATIFPVTVTAINSANYIYWSSSPIAPNEPNATSAWDVNFYSGDAATRPKNNSLVVHFVRLVRGGQ